MQTHSRRIAEHERTYRVLGPKHDDDFASLGTIATPMQFYAQLIAKNPVLCTVRPVPKKETTTPTTNHDLIFNAQRNKKFKNLRRVIAIDEIQLMVKKGGHDGIERL